MRRPLNYIGNNVFIGDEENEGILQFIENPDGEIERIVYGGRHIMKENRLNCQQVFHFHVRGPFFIDRKELGECHGQGNIRYID